jgi:hypothetical protein
LWQTELSYYHTEFYEGKIQINKKKYFDFEKEIIKYNALSGGSIICFGRKNEKIWIEKRRMILERYEERKKQQLTYLRQNTKY